MPRQNPPLPEGLGKAFINTLMEEFANEKKMTLEDYLRESDQRVAVEENYLDRPTNRTFRASDDRTDWDEIMRVEYRDYRDNKKWLDEN